MIYIIYTRLYFIEKMREGYRHPKKMILSYYYMKTKISPPQASGPLLGAPCGVVSQKHPKKKNLPSISVYYSIFFWLFVGMIA